MANEVWGDREFGHLGNSGKTRAMDYKGDQSVFAAVRGSILFDADEIELGTPTNPICITGGGSGVTSVGYDVVELSQTPTVTVGAYTAGDALGGLLTFAGAAIGGKGMITKVVVTDNALQSAPVDLVLFNQAFTPNADNDPFAATDADLQNCLGHIPVANTDYSNFANNCVATKAIFQQMPFEFVLAPGGTTLYGQLKIGNADTFGAVDDISVKITIRRY